MMTSYNFQLSPGAICSAYAESISSPSPATNAENPPKTLRLAEPEPKRARTLTSRRDTLSANPPAVSLSNPPYASASALKTAAEEASPTLFGIFERISSETEAGNAPAASMLSRYFLARRKCFSSRLISLSFSTRSVPPASKLRAANCSAFSATTSTTGLSSVIESESAAGKRNSSLRLPQYLMNAIFGVETARIDISEFHCRHTSFARNLHDFLAVPDCKYHACAAGAAACADDLPRTARGFNSRDKLLCLRWHHAKRNLRLMVLAHDYIEGLTPYKPLRAIADSVQRLSNFRFPASHPCDKFIGRFSGSSRVDKHCTLQKLCGQPDGLYRTSSIQYRSTLPNNGKVETAVPGTEGIFDVKGRLARITEKRAHDRYHKRRRRPHSLAYRNI